MDRDRPEEPEPDPIPESLPASPRSEPDRDRSSGEIHAAYYHPWIVRFAHWLNAISIFVLVTSGLRIFKAFPSFGPKVPQEDFIDIPKALTLGGWLGGALRWHFTFMWIFGIAGAVYLVYQFASGRYRRAFFRWRDRRGVWPMVRHYFFFGPKPAQSGEMYNPLQKLAYTIIVLCGAASLLTGMVLYKPTQLSLLARLFGGYHLARGWHFFAMCGFVAFVPGHLLMVILHGRDNFASMWTGWMRLPQRRATLDEKTETATSPVAGTAEGAP